MIEHAKDDFPQTWVCNDFPKCVVTFTSAKELARCSCGAKNISHHDTSTHGHWHRQPPPDTLAAAAEEAVKTLRSAAATIFNDDYEVFLRECEQAADRLAAALEQRGR
jgi:hypothetical protein